MNILFVTSTRIGDAILSTGLLSHLVTTHPGARITIACGPLPAPLFAAVPGVERVIRTTRQPLALHWVGLWGACVFELWDLVVDLRGSALAWLLAARRRKVLRPARGPARPPVRELAALFDLEPPPAPTVWHTPEALADAGRLIPGGGPVLGLGPTVDRGPGIWPADRFAALADRLTGEGGVLSGARIAVFGTQDEREPIRPLLDALPGGRTIDLVGRGGVATAAACLARCALYVGSDSGLMHLAAAAGTPTLGLFGPHAPVHGAPWGGHAAAIGTEVPYETLDVERVSAAAEALLRPRVGGAV